MVRFLTILGAVLVAAGPAGAQFAILSPMLGGLITGGGMLLLGLLFFIALATFLRRGARHTSWLALVLGLASLGGLGTLGYFGYLHPLNDISTDLKKPPQFLHPAYVFRVEKGAEYLEPSLLLKRDYDPAFPALQQMTYPGFEGIKVRAPAKDVFAAVMPVIRTQLPDWKIVAEDPVAFRAEMEVTSQLFRFVDDVAVEVRPVPNREYDTKVELRSRSRFGRSDLGANERRLRELKVLLDTALKPMDETFSKARAEWELKNKEAPVPAVPAAAVGPGAKK